MIVQQNNVFIDPENCGSSIGYYITTSEYKPKDKPPIYIHWPRERFCWYKDEEDKNEHRI